MTLTDELKYLDDKTKANKAPHDLVREALYLLYLLKIFWKKKRIFDG